MRILNSWHLAPTLLVCIAIAAQPLKAADDFPTSGGLISQISHNPLNIQNGPSSNGFSAPPFASVQNSNGFTASPSLIDPIVVSGTATATATSTVSSSSSQGGSGYNYDDISDAIADNVLQFGHNLGLQLSEQHHHAIGSEIFSPLSLMSALSFLTLGAKGKSYLELKRLIGLDNSSELSRNPSKFHTEFGMMLDDMQRFDVTANGSSKRKQAKWRYNNLKRPAQRNRPQTKIEHTINVANGLFVQSGYSLNPDYRQIVHSVYDSELTQLDYQRKSREARTQINNWVNNSTRGKIPQIITGEIAKSTNIIIASVLYFKGFWETEFFARATTEDNFYLDGPQSKPVRVQMMATGGIFPFYNAKEYDCRIIGLPYQGNETTMYIIQPNDSTRQKLKDLQNVLNGRRINEMIDKMTWKTTVMVFPKMHFTRTMTMKSLLKYMGVQDIFDQGYSDLSLIGVGGSGSGAGASAAPASATAALPSADRGFSNTVTPKSQAAKQQYYDRYREPALVFSSRFGEMGEETLSQSPPAMGEANTEESESTTTEATETSHTVSKRQVPDRNAQSLANLEDERYKFNPYRSDLFVDEIVHSVDFAVDEQGTEAAAATLTYLHRSGTDVIFRGDTPFLIVIRHDPTKLPLFYGVINKPEL